MRHRQRYRSRLLMAFEEMVLAGWVGERARPPEATSQEAARAVRPATPSPAPTAKRKGGH